MLFPPKTCKKSKPDQPVMFRLHDFFQPLLFHFGQEADTPSRNFEELDSGHRRLVYLSALNRLIEGETKAGKHIINGLLTPLAFFGKPTQ